MVHDVADVPTGPTSLDSVRVAFNEERLISDAGLLIAATLSDRLGLEELVNESVWLGYRVPGAALPGRKVMSLVNGMLAGADSISPTRPSPHPKSAQKRSRGNVRDTPTKQHHPQATQHTRPRPHPARSRPHQQPIGGFRLSLDKTRTDTAAPGKPSLSPANPAHRISSRIHRCATPPEIAWWATSRSGGSRCRWRRARPSPPAGPGSSPPPPR
jgi:hypothetical protein